MKGKIKSPVLVFVCLLLTVSCYADVIIVDDDWPYDFNNIQAAIDYSVNGDFIYVFPGTYTGEGNRDIDFDGKAVTVQSIFPEDPYFIAATIVDCNGDGRGFIFQNGEDANSILTGLTIINGNSDSDGAGIYCYDSSPTITNCIISGSTAGDRGGGIFCWNSNSIITNCTISDNTSSLQEPFYDGDGGGIYCTGNPTITNCTITGNTAAANGGGIYCVGNLTITNCTITGNSAEENGGGICCEGGSSSYPKIKNCTFNANSAGNNGGGMYNDSEISTLTNCTFGGNSAGNEGGGIRCYYSKISLTNCILWGNTDSTGLIEAAQINCWFSSELQVIFSCIQDDDPNDANIPFGDPDNHNIDDNPMFVRDPNDGGDGWGISDNDDFGDLHLQKSSPCINAGFPNFSAGVNNVDIDGQPRIVGFCVDMGADEFAPMIIVTKPPAGEVWAGGSTHGINWYSFGITGTVDISYNPNNGGDWVTIENNAANTGGYIWHLPNGVDSNQCLVSVVPSVPDPNALCFESGLFTIHPDSPGPTITSTWESLGGDFRRSGWNPNYGPELGCIKWQFETDAPVSASPTINGDDKVHIACENGRLYTLDIDDGSLLWSYDTNTPLFSAPTIGRDGTVYVGGKNGKLYAVDTNGNLRWTHTTDGFIYSSPAVSPDSQVYVCSQDGSLYALGQDGSELWSFQTAGLGTPSGSILASPTIGADGTVYIGGLYEPNLYALEPNDGALKWACNLQPLVYDEYGNPWYNKSGWPFPSPVVAPDGTIYQTLVQDSNLYAIEPDSGTIIWATDLAGIVVCWGFPEECFTWYGPGEPPVDDPNSPYYGGIIEGWYKYSNCWSEPALALDGTIYVSLDDGRLRAVDPNGSLRWATRLGMMGNFTLTVGGDGRIYAAGDDGHLCVVSPDGEEIARFRSSDWLTFPVIAQDNTIIVAGERDNSTSVGDANNIVWAIGDDGCEDQPYDLHRPQDISADLTVNLVDLAVLALDWLGCTNMDLYADPPCDYQGYETYLAGDINKDLYVDFSDVAEIAYRWLNED